MKQLSAARPYILAILAGLLAGIAYRLLGVTSPAPPWLGLTGLLGILIGESCTRAGIRHIPAALSSPACRRLLARRSAKNSATRGPTRFARYRSKGDHRRSLSDTGSK
ncbi:DUF1427 family protein [Cryobacterium adonitolivorans]|uniref:DUF1427 family protein n=1 Tax=Cryobacterium adonitolivorans TaxID=1259189 RepID=A0A4R8WBA8_9MICO|nr:DUF1427 family protein [Cryobacterium adonitolivorans]